LPGRSQLCQCQATVEQCDGKDNDCDGVIDNPSTGCLTILATGQALAGGLAVDGTNVYFTGSAEVRKVPINGGAVATVAPAPAAEKITIDATNIYFFENAANGAVQSVPIAGGAVTSISAPETWPSAIVVDGTRAYWASAPNGPTPPGAIRSSLLGGGGATTLAKNVFAAHAIAQDALNLYFTMNSSTGAIYTVPKAGVPDGGAPTVLVAAQNSPSAILVDGDKMFWANQGFTGNGGSIFVAQTDGGAVTRIAQFQSAPLSIALDADNVYWVDGVGPHKAPRAGGPVTTIAWGTGSPQAIAVDATSVYWTNWQGGTVMKRTPK
jgi:hypothetical protein